MFNLNFLGQYMHGYKQFSAPGQSLIQLALIHEKSGDWLDG